MPNKQRPTKFSQQKFPTAGTEGIVEVDQSRKLRTETRENVSTEAILSLFISVGDLHARASFG